MDRYALITAGGIGARMGAGQPKQFLELGGVPILMRTLRLFGGLPSIKGIILTLPAEAIEAWEELIERHREATPHLMVLGGATRSESVRNGLALIPDDALVAIHDGVRPFTPASAIEESFRMAEAEGGAVVAFPCQDSLRRRKGEGSEVVARDGMYLVQTPQTFQAGLIKWAYEMADLSRGFTDDASVFEASGHRVALVEGSARNIKITTPDDLAYAKFLIMNS